MRKRTKQMQNCWMIMVSLILNHGKFVDNNVSKLNYRKAETYVGQRASCANGP